MSNESKAEKYGLYLNIKINSNSSYSIFDFSSSNTENFNTFITEKAFLVEDEKNNIKCYEQQGDIRPEDGEIILFYIRIRNNKVYLERNDKIYDKINNNNKEKLAIDEKNIKMLDRCIWKIINYEPNEDYYLKENDIIKIGYIKYFVREIHIENKENKEDKEDKGNKENKDKQKQIFN